MDQLRRRPSDEALRWVEQQMGPGARVVAWRRMTGGITSSVHRLRVRTSTSATTVVLRRWLAKDEEQRRWARDDVTHEAVVLQALETYDLPAPRLLAAASTGDEPDGPDTPSVLMTCVPGQVFLAPMDPERWLGQMASTLVRIHAAPVDAPRWIRWGDPSKLRVPEWSAHPDAWKQAIAIAAEPPPEPATCFVHRDYQHFNMLWARERLTGIVDWPNAAVGPPELDVGHCRLNLAVLFSADWAERFRKAYEAEAGRRVEAAWDLQALLAYGPGWKQFIPVQVAGRVAVDSDHMNERVDTLVALTASRL